MDILQRAACCSLFAVTHSIEMRASAMSTGFTAEAHCRQCSREAMRRVLILCASAALYAVLARRRLQQIRDIVDMRRRRVAAMFPQRAARDAFCVTREFRFRKRVTRAQSAAR